MGARVWARQASKDDQGGAADERPSPRFPLLHCCAVMLHGRKRRSHIIEGRNNHTKVQHATPRQREWGASRGTLQPRGLSFHESGGRRAPGVRAPRACGTGRAETPRRRLAAPWRRRAVAFVFRTSTIASGFGILKPCESVIDSPTSVCYTGICYRTPPHFLHASARVLRCWRGSLAPAARLAESRTDMDRYRVAGVLGDGSFGTVFDGTHVSTGAHVAIKRCGVPTLPLAASLNS